MFRAQVKNSRLKQKGSREAKLIQRGKANRFQTFTSILPLPKKGYGSSFSLSQIILILSKFIENNNNIYNYK
jgi:hypothetical protein